MSTMQIAPEIGATPIPEGTVVYIDKNDANDPRTFLCAYRVEPAATNEGAIWVPLGYSVAGQIDETEEDYSLACANFLAMVRIYAQFHNLPIDNQTGIE
jgi:hypothetical protein